jgi:hypothetical protein
LLIAYGALTATTTLPCIGVLLSTPSTSVPLDFSSSVAGPAVTEWQRWLLLGSYIPFFLIPLGIAVDMIFRTRFLTRKGVWVVQKGMMSKWE